MRNSTTTTASLTGFAAMLALGAMVVVSPAQAAGETCQGQPATIVGTGPDIQGTPGDDVIVTGTSQFTYANAGNDLVCVGPSALKGVYVYGGDGDDGVDASEAGVIQIYAYLGAGLDRYLGGLGQDLVRADGTDDTVTDADWAYLTVTAPATGTPGTYTGSGIAVWSVNHDVEIDLDTNMVRVGGVHAVNLSGIVRANVVAPRAVFGATPRTTI